MNTRSYLAGAAVVLVVIYAFGSGLWVNTGDGWYRSLTAPSWQPSDWVFGLIWPYNFLMLGVAGVMVSRRLSSTLSITWLAIFAISIAAALTWAYQFYVPHNLATASFALLIAAITTLPLIVITFRASLLVGLLLIPYQVWVGIATYLSHSYSKLN